MVLLVLPVIAVAACSASPEAIETAKGDTKVRGFTYLSETSVAQDLFPERVDVQVSFGERGCPGTLRFESGTVKLMMQVGIPNSPTETTGIVVDDPTVVKLREIPTFAVCFGADASKPAS